MWIWKELICLSRFWFLSRFCLNAQGRKEDKFQSLEVREASSLHLKKDIIYLGFRIQTKCSVKSEDTGGFLLLQHKYSISLSWAENLNKLFTDLGGKKFSAHSDLEYLF